LELSNNDKDQLGLSLEDLNKSYNQVVDERNSLERMTIELKDNKQRQQNQNDKLFEDNNKLKKSVDELNNVIKNLEGERNRLLGKIEDISFENNNLNSKLKGREDALLVTQKQLDDSKQANIKLQGRTHELESYNDGLKSEIEKLRLDNNRENKARLDQ